VLRPDGQPAPNARVTLSAADPREPVEQQVVADAQGRFSFPAAPQGDWYLTASWKREEIELRAFGRATVARSDQDSLRLSLAAPFPVTGTVERPDPPDASGRRGATAVYLQPVEGPVRQRVSAFHKDDGSFRMEKVFPGRYRVEPAGVVPGYYLDRILLGDRDILGQEIQLTGAPAPIRVVYAAKGGAVQGTVKSAAAAAVVLLPDDDYLLSPGFIRAVAPDPNGTFRFQNVRPGGYTILAFDRYEREALEDAAFVRGLRNAGLHVSVAGSETAAVEVGASQWPEL
jgi:hypothetical protein